MVFLFHKAFYNVLQATHFMRQSSFSQLASAISQVQSVWKYIAEFKSKDLLWIKTKPPGGQLVSTLTQHKWKLERQGY
jgi:hypothetical protein